MDAASIPLALKSCTKCSGTEFYAKGGCKACAQSRARAYAAKNPEKVKAGKSKWAKANPEKIKEKNHAYNAANPDKRKAICALWRSANADRIKASSAAYYAANYEKINASGASWRAANKDKIRIAAAAYYTENRDKISESHAVYRSNNPDKAKAATAAWVKANQERVRMNNANWHAANPDAKRIREHNRRAKKRENGGQLSKGLAVKLFKLQQGKCACCSLPLGNDFHLDHITPIYLGGSNTDDNIQLLRSMCNLQKGAKEPTEFMQDRGFLL